MFEFPICSASSFCFMNMQSVLETHQHFFCTLWFQHVRGVFGAATALRGAHASTLQRRAIQSTDRVIAHLVGADAAATKVFVIRFKLTL